MSMVHFDPFDYDFHEDPYPTYKRLREEAPCYHNSELEFWALSRHADVLAGFKDSDLFSNSKGVALEQVTDNAESALFILGMDPPRQQKFRGLVSKAFTGRRVDELEQRIRKIARSHAARAVEGGECDYVGDFAGKLPMDVISEMLGVPEGDRDELRAQADLVMHRADGTREIPNESAAASLELITYYVDFVKARRRSTGDGLVDALLTATVDGERLTDEQVISFLFLMTIAGNETTTKLLANAVYWLAKNPEQRRLVEADRSRIPQWIEETLRFDNSSQILGRVATRDVELHGETICEGGRVLLLVGAANRDPAVFEDPDRFDLTRDCTEFVSFGKGVHFCLGARLARLEGLIGLETALEFFPNYQVDDSSLVRVHNTNVRGFASMPITFDSGGDPGGDVR
ncbi:MAG: cytochrome P450 [Candidatus Binatia bacterium]|nr:cytochrome P450 [Candidatus Binatia bacterium]